MSSSPYRCTRNRKELVTNLRSLINRATVNPSVFRRGVSNSWAFWLTLRERGRPFARGLGYIRENARAPIGVDDVVQQLALSRRALEIRFERSLGRSIRTEIQRVRLGWVKQLLVETNMPLARIAESAGFNSLSYLSKVFRRETGETLAQYRRRCRPL